MPKAYNLGRVKGDEGFSPKVNLQHVGDTLTISVVNKDDTQTESIQTGEATNADWNETDTSSNAFILNKPTALSAFTNDKGFITNAAVPSTLAELTGDTTHRVVTDVEKASWNAKAEISDIPTKASDIAALPDTTTHLSGDVPITRQINNKALSDDITLTASDVNAIPVSEKGANNGVATLGTDGKIPSTQLPSYVDDVLEYATKSGFPTTGESGKIYIAIDTNITYRWGGSEYVAIGSDLALGETSSTAYAGDKGKALADAIAALPTSYAPTNAQANVIESIKVNGSTLTPSDKAVDITVPTGAAASKAVDVSISDSSTSTNLPTSKAVADFVEGKGYKTTDNDTKNTAGSTNSSSKLFLIGATSQEANPQTYSHSTVYIGTDGCLYSDSSKVITADDFVTGTATYAANATSAQVSLVLADGNYSIKIHSTSSNMLITGYSYASSKVTINFNKQTVAGKVFVEARKVG